jgi:TolB-like protein/DNA-binding winged helix-turn-helix (wHTH) protein/Tfp pilus assembly protein PilF
VRFGVFELDARTGELRRSGHRVALQPQPLEILRALLERPGEVVTREELRRRVWNNGAYVDFDRSLNKAIVKLRDALGDDADSPRYIETLPRHGYRFIPLPQVHARIDAGSATTGAAVVSSPSATPPAPPRPASWGPLGWIGGTLIIVVLLAASWAIVHYRGASKPAEQTNSGTAPAPIHSLAVLPLENLSGDKEQEYFADGMTDALTTDLAQIGALSVISRTSAMQFKGSKETLPQIGRDLKVDAVVEGAVTRGENRVRVTAQLVEASSDHHLWARTYERDLKDVLALQDEIAQDIAEQIRVKLTPKERSLLIQAHAVDPEAHDAYLRGRYWAYKETLEGGWKAIEYYQKAIAKDPNYALAYAGLANAFVVVVINKGLSRKEGAPKVNEAASKALELDPSLAEPHTSLALVKLFANWDWSGAETEFKQSIALNPNLADAHQGYSRYLVIMQRLDEAVNESERARDLDPLDFRDNEWASQALYHARRYEDALRQLRRTLEMFPDRSLLYDDIADVYEQKKMFAEAFAARQQALSLRHDPMVTLLEEAYKRSGYRGYLLKAIQIIEETHEPSPGLAHLYAILDDEAHAMPYLERGYRERYEGILFVRTAPELDSIRSSARFRDLVRRIGFPERTSEKN